jgi:hypothetical protein
VDKIGAHRILVNAIGGSLFDFISNIPLSRVLLNSLKTFQEWGLFCFRLLGRVIGHSNRPLKI